MQPTAANNAQATDIATRIVYTMRQMGVVGLPRNYEIFYEICTGANEELCDELRAFGSRPTQAELDLLSGKYFAQRDGARAIEHARDEVARTGWATYAA